MTPEEQLARWDDAALVAACIAVAGHSVGGVKLKSRAGPVRDVWLEQARALLPEHTPWRKVPVHCSESRLLGGLDLTATLRSGTRVAERGLLVDTHDGVVVLAMAERAPSMLVAPISAVLDDPFLNVQREGIAARHPCRLMVIALDEGVDDEALSPVLSERLALEIDLNPVSVNAVDDFPWTVSEIDSARRAYAEVSCGDEALESLCRATQALGIDSARVLLLAARISRALAAIAGRDEVGDAELEQVLRLVLLPRATRLPSSEPEEAPQDEQKVDKSDGQDAEPEEDRPEPPPELEQDQNSNTDIDRDDSANETAKTPPEPLDDERILDAATALLPPDLLARLAAGTARSRRPRAGGKSGARQRHKRRGRPMGSQPGDPRNGERLDLMATLRAAAPWQRLRGKNPRGAKLSIESQDFRVVRFKQRAQSVTVFVVDASGSSALYRLAEAKGAVELLLADCYVRRDEVALIAFRGEEAELVLPPTRSLVRAKRSLSALPGGGGTPLTAAIEATREMLEQLDHQGATPHYVMLTDGRANVSRDGSKGREAAMEEALIAAAMLGERGSGEGIVIDTSPRPHRAAGKLATALNAIYLPLPNADAAQLQAAVKLTSG
ncbi:MAG: magnesium chelatase subunit D [Congregibacter sp.]